MHLQPRDLELLAYLADDFLLLDREQIQMLIPRSKRRTNQRLAILVQAGYLARRDPRDRFSPQVVFYYLGEQAAKALARDHAMFAERPRRAASFADSHLRHLYDLSWVHIGFLKVRSDDYHLTLWVDSDRAGWDGAPNFPIRPDAYLEYDKAGNHYAAFVELDRGQGTERRSYLAEKMQDYLSYERSGEFRKQFGREWFRVLCITESESRAKALLKLFPSDVFWVATLEVFRSRPLFDPYWQSPNGPGSLDLIPPREDFLVPVGEETPPDPSHPSPETPNRISDAGRSLLNPEFREYLAREKKPSNSYWLLVPAAGLLGFLVTAFTYFVYQLSLEALELSAKIGLNTETLGLLLILAAVLALIQTAP